MNTFLRPVNERWLALLFDHSTSWHRYYALLLDCGVYATGHGRPFCHNAIHTVSAIQQTAQRTAGGGRPLDIQIPASPVPEQGHPKSPLTIVLLQLDMERLLELGQANEITDCRGPQSTTKTPFPPGTSKSK